MGRSSRSIRLGGSCQLRHVPNAIESIVLTSVVECESDRVCRELVASLETLLEVSANVVPDLWAGIGVFRWLFSPSCWLFVTTSRRLSIPEVKADVRYG